MALPELNLEKPTMNRTKLRKCPLKTVVTNSGEREKIPVLAGSRRKRDPRKDKEGRKRVQKSRQRSRAMKQDRLEKFGDTCGLLDTGYFSVSDEQLKGWWDTYPTDRPDRGDYWIPFSDPLMEPWWCF